MELVLFDKPLEISRGFFMTKYFVFNSSILPSGVVSQKVILLIKLIRNKLYCRITCEGYYGDPLP